MTSKKQSRYCFTHIGVMYDTEKMYDEEGEFTGQTHLDSHTGHRSSWPDLFAKNSQNRWTFEDEEVFCAKCGAPLVEYILHQNEG